MPIQTNDYQIKFQPDIYNQHYIELSKLIKKSEQYFKKFDCQIQTSDQPNILQVINHGNSGSAKTLIHDILEDYFYNLYMLIQQDSYYSVGYTDHLKSQLRPTPTTLVNENGVLYSFGQALLTEIYQYPLITSQNTISFHHDDQLIHQLYLPFNSWLPDSLFGQTDQLDNLKHVLNDTANVIGSMTFNNQIHTMIPSYLQQAYTLIPQLCQNAYNQLSCTYGFQAKATNIDPHDNFQRAGSTIGVIIMLLLNINTKSGNEELHDIQKITNIK